ncbi:hypothetical protein [Chitinophaga sp. CF418]|uniref:hypothetical protein n=1 Tax=Chitinophaga sp. CF418 TaxID=1855287 RepID=UPI0009168638|nr:hypothetical protein [Chitinophaga sp. CF418]SHN33310.1 hypothetical protein SAMN05216311_109161 [Chitinophaga sp. CF418]
MEKLFIPNEDYVFCRVGADFISSKDHKPRASAFRNTPVTGGNLSCDWDKYCTAESSRALIGRQFNVKTGKHKDPSKFYIYKFNVGAVRNMHSPGREQEIEHDPVYNDPEIEGAPNNIAHSIMIGDKGNDEEFRIKLVETGSWAIRPGFIKVA